MQLIPKPELSEKIDTMQYDRHLIVADKNGQIYRITKKFDEDGLENPRSFGTCVGKMVCWHKRYALGDEQPKETPSDYCKNLILNEIIGESKTKQRQKFIDAMIENGKKDGGKTYLNLTGNAYVLMQSYYENHNGTDLRTYMSDCSQEGATAETISDKFLTTCVNTLYAREENPMLEALGFVILPIHLYDHSGLSVSVHSFNDRWDSGQIGYIHTKQPLDNATLEMRGRDEIAKMLEQEVEEYDRYLNGEAAGIIIEELTDAPRHCKDPYELDGSYFQEIESCWGFDSQCSKDMADFITNTIGPVEQWDITMLRPASTQSVKTTDCVFCSSKDTVKLYPTRLTGKLVGTCAKCEATYHE